MLTLLLAGFHAVALTVGPVPAPPDTLMPVADSAAMATAYLDEGARDLVRRARLQRGMIDASVFRYQATSKQRLSVGLRALSRERVVYRRETASRLEWRRDGPGRVEVLGAREAVPIALPGIRVPSELEEWARQFVPAPGDDRLFVAPTGGGFAWHPLVDGGEALYRYATGDTTVIRLPDGRSVRLAELRVQPRERDIRVVTGSFWIELDNYAIVQAVFLPAREFDLERDLATLDPDDDDSAAEVPRLLRPVRFDVRYIAVDYGLWEMRWWMPRLMAFEGSLQVGPARFPVSIELTYADYVVEPDRHGLPELPPLMVRLAGDTTGRAREYRYPVRVVLADTAELLASPLLSPSFLNPSDRLITSAELREVADRLGALPSPPWEAGRPVMAWPWHVERGLLRYNRVEGLSAGVRADWDLNRVQLDATLRLGATDLVPNVELGVDLPGFRRDWRAAAYHRLAAVDPASRPFGLQNSASALLFGLDEGLYFRASGAEALVVPAVGVLPVQARFYVERQRPVAAGTDFSVRRLLNDEHEFRPNIEALPADQVGLALAVVADRGAGPATGRTSAALDLVLETGSYTFARPGLTLSAGAPLSSRAAFAAEVGAGTTVGGARAAPPQARWYLGGPSTLRGFPTGAFAGPDHLRGRLELGNRLPAARLVVFGDAGWAGSFSEYRHRDLAVSAGAGVSLLDGLFRLDIARAVRPDRQWRAHLYLDGLF